MKYKSFEDLPVWQAAVDLARRTYTLTEHQAFRGHAGLRDQLERAALSVSNNIAEGFERGTTNELLAFLYIARGSSGEVRSMFCLLERIPGFFPLKSEIGNLKSAVSASQGNSMAGSSSLRILISPASDILTTKSAPALLRRRTRKSFSKN
jgi:four helix bundle protein